MVLGGSGGGSLRRLVLVSFTSKLERDEGGFGIRRKRREEEREGTNQRTNES